MSFIVLFLISNALDEAHMRIVYKQQIEKEGVVHILLNGYANSSVKEETPSKLKIGTVFG